MTKYDDYDWKELPAEAKKAAEALGYNKKMWDKDKEPEICDKYWDDLTPAMQQAATLLGYSKETWNEPDSSSSSSDSE